MSTGGVTAHIVSTRPPRRVTAFDPAKLHTSIVGVCLSAGAPTGSAENIARRVVEEVSLWLETRPEVTTADLRRVVGRALKPYHPDASYLYEHHRSTL